MTLRDEIISKCSPDLLALHDTNAIANVINSGRVKPNKVEIGNGTILEVLGLSVGNALLDIIYTDSNFRHVKPLVEQGRLTIGSPLVQGTLQSMVGAVLTQEQANMLCSMGMGMDPDPIDELEIRKVCWSDNGDWLL